MPQEHGKAGSGAPPQGIKETKTLPHLPLKMQPWEGLWILLLALTLVESLPHQL